mgnify:CR=1 FL=1
MDSRESATLVALAKETDRVGGSRTICATTRCASSKGPGRFGRDWASEVGPRRIPARLAHISYRLELAPRIKLGGELRAVSDIGAHWLDLINGSPAKSGRAFVRI